MARISKEQRLLDVHEEALSRFDDIQSALRDERLQCLQDRRFYSLSGAQWEGPLGYQFENKPRFEVNKIHLAVIRIINEYRNSRVTVDFIAKDGATNEKLAETCDMLFRADEQDSTADEAYDNAFEEAVAGGFGAWRLRSCYEDEYDPENEHQRIKIEPIFDADSSVFFDLDAKRQDKADARYCYVVHSVTREAYKEEWGDDPSDWPKLVQQVEFDWDTPDVVYLAEYYRVEEASELIRTFRNIDDSEEKYSQSDFEADEELEETLAAIGAVEVKQRRIKRRRVRKYILSGGKILEDCGYIPGTCIPVVPVYGKRWFVDNVERCMGHVRLAKDAQRLKNMQLSKLGEISALSSVEKPIMVPEQVAGHQVMWAEDNIKNYPYLLVNPINSTDGTQQFAGPLAYTRSPAIPPALAGLLQLTEQDMADILGNQGEADKIVSNISGKAVEMIQQRLDGQTFIYMSNFAKAMKRCGEIWLAMAQEIYVEEGRKMKGVAVTGDTQPLVLMRPKVDEETGRIEFEHDLSDAKFDVVADVGPSSASKKSAAVRALTGMMQITSDPETQMVLQALALMNMEAEGLGDVQDFFRKRLVGMGVVKPTEEELAEMELAAGQGQPQDPNAIYLQAAAEEAVAKAEKARADVIDTIADAELKQAKTAEVLAGIGVEPVAASASPPSATPGAPASTSAASPAPNVLDEIETEKKLLQLEQLRLETSLKFREAQAKEDEKEQLEKLRQAELSVQDAAEQLVTASQDIKATIDALIRSNESTAKDAIEAIKRPKRIIREKGRIVGVE
jgi:hypothetical protein